MLRYEDLAALALPTKRTVDVLGFVDERGADPVLYSRRYWVGAAGEQDQRPYALLVEALAQRARSIDREPVPAFAPPSIRPRDRTPSGSLPRNTRRRSPHCQNPSPFLSVAMTTGPRSQRAPAREKRA